MVKGEIGRLGCLVFTWEDGPASGGTATRRERVPWTGGYYDTYDCNSALVVEMAFFVDTPLGIQDFFFFQKQALLEHHLTF